jgi:hypothetical protein
LASIMVIFRLNLTTLKYIYISTRKIYLKKKEKEEKEKIKNRISCQYYLDCNHQRLNKLVGKFIDFIYYHKECVRLFDFNFPTYDISFVAQPSYNLIKTF